MHVLNNEQSSLGGHTRNCNSKENIKLFTVYLTHCGFSNDKYILQCEVYMGLFGESKAGEVTGTRGKCITVFLCLFVSLLNGHNA